MPEAAIVRPTKLPSLDFGRFVAAFLVVLYHMGITVENFVGAKPFGMAFQGGHSGVSYFFVLSGFIIVYVHRADIGHADKLATFARKRVVRIVPLLWMTMIGWGAVRLFLPGGTGNGLHPAAILWDCLLLPHHDESVIGAVWTLRREAVFYLLFATAIFRPKIGIVLLAAWQAGVVIQAIHPFFTLGAEPAMLFGIHNLGFGIGMALALIVPRSPSVHHRLLIVGGCMLYGAMLVLEWRFNTADMDVEAGGIAMFVTLAYLAASGIVVAGMVSGDLLAPRAPSTLGSRLGDSSYALYLTQGPVGSVAIRALRPLWGLVSPEVLMLMLVATTIVAAILINRFLERPLMRRLGARVRPGIASSARAA